MSSDEIKSKMEQQNPETSGYLEELRVELRQTNPNSQAGRLLKAEIGRIEKGEAKERIVPWVSVHPNNPQPFSVRVRIPVKEHPRFNFVGKLLGPKGTSLKRLQEETGTKMSILGRGSMRDKNKEDEMRKEGGKYAHLNDELHVFVEVFSEMTDNFGRLAHALSELKKFLQPEHNDDIRQQQLQDMMYMSNGDKGMAPSRGRGAGGPPGGPPSFRGAPRGGRGGLMPPPTSGRDPSMRGAPRGRGTGPSSAPTGSRGGPGLRGARGGPSRGMGRGSAPSSRGLSAPRGRPAPPPQPVAPAYDDYSAGDYGVQSMSGYDDYGHSQTYAETDYDTSYGGQSDTQFFDYGHGSGSAAGGYDDYGEAGDDRYLGGDYYASRNDRYSSGDGWGSGSGPVKTSHRGTSKGQFRSHPYSQRGGY